MSKQKEESRKATSLPLPAKVMSQVRFWSIWPVSSVWLSGRTEVLPTPTLTIAAFILVLAFALLRVREQWCLPSLLIVGLAGPSAFPFL